MELTTTSVSTRITELLSSINSWVLPSVTEAASGENTVDVIVSQSQGSETNTETTAVDDAPVHLAFAIDHIREKIFSYMSVEDLKNCRLVCQQWEEGASLELQDRITITFEAETKVDIELYLSQLPRTYHYYIPSLNCKSTDTDSTAKPRCLIQEFTALVNHDKSTPSPFTNFQILNTQLPPTPDFIEFLSIHGEHIKTLTLSFGYFCGYPVLTAKDRIESLQMFLVEKTPNLNKLKLYLELGLGDVELNSLQNKQRSSNGNAEAEELVSKHLKLKYVELNTSHPKTSLNWICDLAPNLQEIQMYPKLLPFLISPMKNRLHLLKQLDFAPSEESLDLLRRIGEEIERNEEGGLQLQELSLALGWTYANPESWRVVIKILQQILRSSSHSLRKIKWSRMGFLCGLKIPPLPNLNTLEIGYDNLPPFRKQAFFPPGMNLLETFPRLQIVRLCKDCLDLKVPLDCELDSSAITFPASVEDPSLFALPTVRYLYLKGIKDYPNVYLQTLMQWFPSATIRWL